MQQTLPRPKRPRTYDAEGEPDRALSAAYLLSICIAALMGAASAVGLFAHDLYRDNLLISSGWYGNDLVTLLVAVPVLVAALALARRGSGRAQLVWLGMLAYTLYNYAFYLFGAAFNSLFLIYAALFTLSVFALIFGLAPFDVERIAGAFRPRTPVRWISLYMLLVALLLGGFWTALSLGYVFTGQVPSVITTLEMRTNLIAALDLSMVVSFGALGAVWLWRQRSWGYVLAVIWNVKGTVYMAALSASTIAAVRTGASEDPSQVALWGPIGVGCLIASVVLLRNLDARSGTKVSSQR